MNNRLYIHGLGLGLAAISLLLFGCRKDPTTVPMDPSSSPHTNLTLRREVIYFIKGDATLSPGALNKIKNWVETLGTSGTWRLACPSDPGVPYDLLAKRILALRSEFQKLGVTKIETALLPKEPAGPYDPIYILKELR